MIVIVIVIIMRIVQLGLRRLVVVRVSAVIVLNGCFSLLRRMFALVAVTACAMLISRVMTHAGRTREKCIVFVSVQ